MNILEDRILQNFHILIVVNDDFRNNLHEVRQKLKQIKELKYCFVKRSRKGVFKKKEDELDKILEGIVPKVAKKYNLSSTYNCLIKAYLETGRVPHIFHGYTSFKPFVVDDPSNANEKIVVISLPPELTISELQKNWKSISSNRDILQSQLDQQIIRPQKSSPRKNTLRDLMIYELRTNIYTAKQIIEVINKQFPDSQVLTTDEIFKIVKRLKNVSKRVTSGQVR